MELDRETFEQTMRAMTEHLEHQERLIQVLVDDLKTRHSQGKLYIHGERMYDSKELAQMLLMGERTLQRYRTSGELPYIKLHRHAYYRENIDLAGVPAERVLMVGNDTGDDLSCLDLGMDAYLVTDHLINPDCFDIDTIKHGSLADFANWVEGLPDCTCRSAFAWRQRADVLRLGSEEKD